jgi:hypothetical protein
MSVLLVEKRYLRFMRRRSTLPVRAASRTAEASRVACGCCSTQQLPGEIDLTVCVRAGRRCSYAVLVARQCCPGVLLEHQLA